jgi:hypothetical protein
VFAVKASAPTAVHDTALLTASAPDPMAVFKLALLAEVHCNQWQYSEHQ